MSDIVDIAAGPFSLCLAPAIGGGMIWFRRDNVDLLRPTTAAAIDAGNARKLGSYPLIPFSNRIAQGRFSFQGRDVVLKPTPGFEPHAIHGDGFIAHWSVDHLAPDAATLRLDHVAGAGGGWPWAYRARQKFALSAAGLTIDLEIENRDATAMPAGMGIHPYFPLTPRATITARCASVWTAAPDKLPIAAVPATGRYDLSAGPALATLGLDHCFAGWDGRVVLDWPERGLRLTMTADAVFGHLVVASPLAPDYGAVEPVTHANNAVNLAGDTGLRILEPGAVLRGRIAVTVATLTA